MNTHTAELWLIERTRIQIMDWPIFSSFVALILRKRLNRFLFALFTPAGTERYPPKKYMRIV